MENPSSWKPIHHAIQSIIETNTERSLLAYELLEGLRKGKLLPKAANEETLVEAFDDAIWAHEDALKVGLCGISLPMRLGRVLNK
jgi:hypothetical protein